MRWQNIIMLLLNLNENYPQSKLYRSIIYGKRILYGRCVMYYTISEAETSILVVMLQYSNLCDKTKPTDGA